MKQKIEQIINQLTNEKSKIYSVFVCFIADYIFM